MKRFIQSDDRMQGTLFPEYLEDYVAENNPVRVVDVFVEYLDLGGLGFNRAEPAITGRPSYHPSVLLKLYVYGYLNRIQSSRRLEKETQRNVELMWLLGANAGIQDHRQFPQGQWPCHTQSVRPICPAVPATQPVF